MGVITYKCPNCGGELTFDPKGQGYHCEYCGSSFSLEEIDHAEAQSTQGPDGSESGAFEQDGADKSGSEQTGDEVAEYSCPSCGAVIQTAKTTAATFCYYCHNPVIFTGQVDGKYRPDAVVPFRITEKEAKEALLKTIRAKRFVPKAFIDDSQVEKMVGVYYPFWVYETDMDGVMQAEGTSVHVSRLGDEEITETKIYHVERRGDIHVQGMSENALKSEHAELVENVRPFRLEESKPFQTGFLSGFQAERRDREKEQVADRLKKDSETYASRMLQDSIGGYTSVRVTGEHYAHHNEQWKYTLLPVWVMTYTSGGSTYYYAMNAQTGKVCGKYPVDYRKVITRAAIWGLLVMTAVLIGGYLI